MNVSVVIPARNEEATLPAVLADVFATVGRLPQHDFEVICVDDHSTDGTRDVVRRFGATLVENRRRSGKGMALRAGFEHARGDVLMMMDADYSHRAEAIPEFLNALVPGVGMVIGSRVFGGSAEYTHIRALGNVFLSAALGLCTRRYLSDALNGYKAFRRDVFTDFTYTSRAFEIEIELLANTMRKGYGIVEISCHERARAGGEAKSRVIRHGTGFLARILREGFKGVTPQPEPVATPVVDRQDPVTPGQPAGV